MNVENKINQVLAIARKQLEACGVEDASQEASLLLAWCLEKPRSWVMAHSDEEASMRSIAAFFLAVERRKKGEPYAYITGETEFFSLPFLVNSHVLIPRPDTEILVETALSVLGVPQKISRSQNPSFEGVLSTEKAKQVRILEIGVGSGCISCTIAYCMKKIGAFGWKTDNAGINITGIDISENALAVARQNSVKLCLEPFIHFEKADVLSETFHGFIETAGEEAAISQPSSSFPERYHMIVSNPPYIPTEDLPGLMVDVRDYEPTLALDGGMDGLVFYRRIAEKAKEWLCPQGVVIVEIGISQESPVSELFQSAGAITAVVPDLHGIPRVVVAMFP
jgi:release factor glutamine methyltransferase